MLIAPSRHGIQHSLLSGFVRSMWLRFRLFSIVCVAALKTVLSSHPQPPPPVAWFNLTAAGIADLSSCGDFPVCANYEAQALVFAISGVLNRRGPSLMLDTGAMNYDAPQSDSVWKAHFETEKNFTFTTIAGDVCALLDHFKNELADTAVLYDSDGWSVHFAMTTCAVCGALPVSAQLMQLYPCLASLKVTSSIPRFSNHTEAYEWAIDTLLPLTSPDIVFNANFYPTNTRQALMSADYPVMQRAFVMNIQPCWQMVGSPPCNSSQASDTALFTSILRTRGNLVSVWGWSDPEHSYTNATTHAGGAVFCTFSTSNLAFWSAVANWSGSKGLPVQRHHHTHPSPSRAAVYITFETNEGDTPRISTSQFLSQWMSPLRGSVPVSWAVDPMLAGAYVPLPLAFPAPR
jgi:hypothetical protein